MHNQPDLIPNVANASQLRRNLPLTIEVLELGYPVTLVLNMIDDLYRTGIEYDQQVLKDTLGCRVIATNARSQQGIDALRQAATDGDQPAPQLALNYPPMLQQAIRQASTALVDNNGYSPQLGRWLAIQFISNNKVIRRYAKDKQLTALLSQQRYYDAQHFANRLFDTRIRFIEDLLAKARRPLKEHDNLHLTGKIDRVVTNPLLGLPIFVLIFFMRLDIIWHGTWDKGKGFIRKAGTIVFAGTVLIWVLASFGPHGFVTDSANSFAAGLGHLLVPLFKPIGVVQWQAISALFTGILAKEVITSSMIVMFHTSSKAVLIGALGQFMTPVVAYSLLVFILLYAPCFATLATIKQETGASKWVVYSVVSSLVVAYLVSFVVFQLGQLI